MLFDKPTQKMVEGIIVIALVTVILTVIIVLVWPALINVLNQIVAAF